MVVWCRAWEIWNNYAAIFQCSGFKAANRQPNLLFYFLNGQTTVESYELDQMLWNIFDIRIGYTKLRHIHCAVIRSALVMVNDSECANRINGRIPWTLNTLIHKRMTNNIHTLRTLYTCIADSISSVWAMLRSGSSVYRQMLCKHTVEVRLFRCRYRMNIVWPTAFNNG